MYFVLIILTFIFKFTVIMKISYDRKYEEILMVDIRLVVMWQVIKWLVLGCLMRKALGSIPGRGRGGVRKVIQP